MRWTGGGLSGDIEDRRGRRLRAGGLGIGATLVLGVLGLLFGQDFLSLVGGGVAEEVPGEYQESPEERRLVEFVSFVLDDVQATWARELPRSGRSYDRAKLVLFTDRVRSGCGYGEAAMGPFYCPVDHKAYIDLGFYRELRARFGAPGDFAQAYVLAHEIGHHVQTLLGTSAKVRAAQQQRPAEANRLQVRMELQADCYAGLWAHSTARRDLLEAGDVEEALGAAAAIGDDRIQEQAGGGVNPETWTHGSAAQRVEWFRRGLEAGSLEACDTFAPRVSSAPASRRF